mgnify:FL=1
MSVRIVIDSTVDVAPELAGRFAVVPLTVTFGHQEFIDGITITHPEFYNRLIESDVLPTTSQATPAAFDAVLSEIAQAGDTAVIVTLAHQLSGTCQSARLAAGEYREFYVVDSGSVTIGAGILAEYALRCADSGMTARQIAAALEEKKRDICLIAMLDTLEYLKRGGRISATVAFAGGILNIKPVVNVVDGVIHILGKARGSRQGNNLLVQEISRAGGIDFSLPILLGYTGLTDALLKKYIADSAPLWKNGVDCLRCTTIGSVVGTHVGPGAIAAAFFRKS